MLVLVLVLVYFLALLLVLVLVLVLVFELVLVLVFVLVLVLVLVRHSTFPIDYYDGGTVHGVLLLIITRGSTPRTRRLVLLTLVLGTHVYKVKVKGQGCLYLHMETHPLRNNFTAGTRGSFSPAGISDHSGNIQFVDGGKGAFGL